MPPTLSAFAALLLLLLAFIATLALVVLVALALEQRARMAKLRREVRDSIRSERACVLRDVTHGRPKHESDASTSNDSA